MNNPNEIAAVVKAELVVTLTREDIEDIIVTAIEGGIGYWCCLDNTGSAYESAPADEPVSITAAKLVLDGEWIILIDEEEDQMYDLDLEKLSKGVKLWLENGSDNHEVVRNGRIDFFKFDAIAADEIIQYSLFDEVLYA